MSTGKDVKAADEISSLRIEQGVCHALFVYDAARSINLDEAERRIHATSYRQTIPHKRNAPSYFEYRPPPLRISYASEPCRIGRFLAVPSVDLMLYDFGAVSVGYTVALDRSSFEDLLVLAEELRDNAFLLSDSRKRVADLLEVIGETATHANIADVVEDYVTFHIEALSQPFVFDPETFVRDYRLPLAQILRAERRTLSETEIEDALGARMSYSVDDLVIADWSAALLIDREGDDVREVLQFANVELLEVRYLDQRLDGALDRAYETLSHTPAGIRAGLGLNATELESIARLQVDNATLFEGVNNSLKLLGDPYLARVYRLVSRRFHLDDWDAGILRKLETLESIYQKMSDRASTRRMEALEWGIIILFVLSIAIELLRLGKK